MGSRGLSSQKSGGAPSEWKLNKKNAADYHIDLKQRHTEKVPKESYDSGISHLNNVLETINILNDMLGLEPEYAPNILFQYGAYSLDAYGDAQANFWNSDEYVVIDKKTGEIIKEYDARIRIYINAMNESHDTGAHEYVHALEAYWVVNNYSVGMDRVNAWKIGDWQGSIYSVAIVKNALVNLGLMKGTEDVSESVWRKAAGTVYRFPGDTYPTSNTSETLTTSVQMVMRYGDKASPFAKEVVKSLRKAAREQQKLIKQKKAKSKKK